MEGTINIDIEIEVKVERIQEIVIEKIQEKDMSKIGVEIQAMIRQMQPRARMLSGEREDRSRSRSNSTVSTNRDRIRSYGCREYDHFMVECPNTPTDEELNHSDVEQVASQMLMQENIPMNSEGQECLNL